MGWRTHPFDSSGPGPSPASSATFPLAITPKPRSTVPPPTLPGWASEASRTIAWFSGSRTGPPWSRWRRSRSTPTRHGSASASSPTPPASSPPSSGSPARGSGACAPGAGTTSPLPWRAARSVSWGLDREIAAASPGRRYLLAKRRDGEVADEVRGFATRLAERTCSELEPLARQARRLSITADRAIDAPDSLLLDLVFLVDDDRYEPFRERLSAWVVENADGLRWEFTGPWPPYHFAET
jgi:hypothetical protein